MSLVWLALGVAFGWWARGRLGRDAQRELEPVKGTVFGIREYRNARNGLRKARMEYEKGGWR